LTRRYQIGRFFFQIVLKKSFGDLGRKQIREAPHAPKVLRRRGPQLGGGIAVDWRAKPYGACVGVCDRLCEQPNDPQYDWKQPTSVQRGAETPYEIVGLRSREIRQF